MMLTKVDQLKNLDKNRSNEMLEFKSAVQRVTAVTEDELRTYDSNISTKHKYNVFSAFFDSLAKLDSTRRYTQPKRTDYDQRKTPESDLSHSSQEDKEEMGTNVCLEKFLSACLKETELGGLSNNRHLVWYVDDTLHLKSIVLMETAMRGLWM